MKKLDDNMIPPFCQIPQEVRNQNWEKNPPKMVRAFIQETETKLDPDTLEVLRFKEEQEKLKAASRIAKMKVKLNTKTIDFNVMRWNSMRARFEPINNTQETEMSKAQVEKYNSLVATAKVAGVVVKPVKAFHDSKTGEERIKALEAKIKETSKPGWVFPTKQPITKEVLLKAVKEKPAAPKKEEKPQATGIAAEFRQRPGGNREKLLLILEKNLDKMVTDEKLAKGLYGEDGQEGAMRMVMKGLIEACPKTYQIKREGVEYGLFQK